MIKFHKQFLKDEKDDINDIENDGEGDDDDDDEDLSSDMETENYEDKAKQPPQGSKTPTNL